MFQTYFSAYTAKVVLTSRNTRFPNFRKHTVIVEREREMEKENNLREKETTKWENRKLFERNRKMRNS